MTDLPDDVTCGLLRALADHESDETPEEAFEEAWDRLRERSGSFDAVVRELHRRGFRARSEVRREHELGNQKPMSSTALVVEGITSDGIKFIHEHCQSKVG